MAHTSCWKQKYSKNTTECNKTKPTTNNKKETKTKSTNKRQPQSPQYFLKKKHGSVASTLSDSVPGFPLWNCIIQLTGRRNRYYTATTPLVRDFFVYWCWWIILIRPFLVLTNSIDSAGRCAWIEFYREHLFYL